MPALALLALMTLAGLGRTGSAGAAEFSVRSETVGEAYRIRGRDGLFTFPKTRLIQSLTLFGGHVFKPVIKGKAIPLSLSLNVSLMLDHDFNVAEAEMNPESTGSYVPLVSKTNLGFLRGYLTLSYGKLRRMDLKIGRQTAYDVTGMYAFDGLKAGFTWFGIAAADFSYGFETVPMFNLAVMDFSPEGVSWGSREGLLDNVHPEITQPELRPMMVATVKLLASRWGALSIGYRRTYGTLDMDGVSFERLSFGFSASNEQSPLSASVVASWDFLWERISEIVARTSLQLAPKWSMDVDFTHYYPVFDSSSIFNVFMFDPFKEVFAGFSFEPQDSFTLSAGALARQTDRSYPDDLDGEIVSDAGGELHATLRSGPFHLTAGARITDGESGTIAGLEASPQVHLLNETLILRLGTGLWFFKDPLRSGHHTISGGGTAAAAWTIYRGVRIAGSVNVFNNRISGFGLSTVWVLAIAL